MTLQVKKNVLALLVPYQKSVEEAIDQLSPRLGPEGAVRSACEYALKSGGKRFRPALLYLVANALGKNRDVSEAALAIELFHTASLVADDLPCMDDDDMRRNKPSVHATFGETVAILSTYAMIAAGYDCLSRNAKILGDSEAGLLAVENVSKNTGILGATGGQALDLCPPDASEATLCQIIEQKTSTLFEVSFVLGWLFGGGDKDLLPGVKKAASHFGMAFQIADDFQDLEQDKAQGHGLNYALILGEESARERLVSEVELYFSQTKDLGIYTKELSSLAEVLLHE